MRFLYNDLVVDFNFFVTFSSFFDLFKHFRNVLKHFRASPSPKKFKNVENVSEKARKSQKIIVFQHRSRIEKAHKNQGLNMKNQLSRVSRINFSSYYRILDLRKSSNMLENVNKITFYKFFVTFSECLFDVFRSFSKLFGAC